MKDIYEKIDRYKRIRDYFRKKGQINKDLALFYDQMTSCSPIYYPKRDSSKFEAGIQLLLSNIAEERVNTLEQKSRR